MVNDDLTLANLDVYPAPRGGWRHPEHGIIDVPEGWDFLEAGNPAVTRAVKTAGVFWTAWQPKSRHRPRRRQLGVLAPKTAIDTARDKTLAPEPPETKKRLVHRPSSAATATKTEPAPAKPPPTKLAPKERARRERQYRDDLVIAVVEFLDFAPAHDALATRIAQEAAQRAAVPTSGRNGKALTLTLAERAARAARVTIRHQFTDYDDTLDALTVSDFWDDERLYREAKGKAYRSVEAFLADHRRR